MGLDIRSRTAEVTLKVLITGATGLIGTRLGQELVRQGHEVFALTRAPEASLPYPAQVIVADLAKGTIEDGRLSQIDAVIHLAGESVGEGRWTSERKRKLVDSRVLATANLFNSAGLNPKVVLGASAVGYYGDRGDEVLTEDSGPGDDFLADLCVKWEQASNRFKEKGARVVLLRTAMVLSRRGGALTPLLPLFRTGLAGKLGGGSQWMSWIHLEDHVRLQVHLLTSEIDGPVNMCAPAPVTNADFTKHLADRLGVTAAVPAPALALKLALGEKSALVLASQRAVPAKALANGFKFTYADLGAALQELFPAGEEGEELFETEQFVPGKLDDLFSFFSDAGNLQKITPPMLDFHIVGEVPKPIRQDAIINYKLKIRGVPVRWRTRIAEWNPPMSFVDTQEEGPYGFWHHTHTFEPLKNGVLMKDRVRYRLPYGKIGKAVGALVRSDVEGIFKFRHQVIGDLFGKT